MNICWRKSDNTREKRHDQKTTSSSRREYSRTSESHCPKDNTSAATRELVITRDRRRGRRRVMGQVEIGIKNTDVFESCTRPNNDEAESAAAH